MSGFFSGQAYEDYMKLSRDLFLNSRFKNVLRYVYLSKDSADDELKIFVVHQSFRRGFPILMNVSTAVKVVHISDIMPPDVKSNLVDECSMQHGLLQSGRSFYSDDRSCVGCISALVKVDYEFGAISAGHSLSASGHNAIKIRNIKVGSAKDSTCLLNSNSARSGKHCHDLNYFKISPANFREAGYSLFQVNAPNVAISEVLDADYGDEVEMRGPVTSNNVGTIYGFGAAVLNFSKGKRLVESYFLKKNRRTIDDIFEKGDSGALFYLKKGGKYFAIGTAIDYIDRINKPDIGLMTPLKRALKAYNDEFQTRISLATKAELDAYVNPPN